MINIKIGGNKMTKIKKEGSLGIISLVTGIFSIICYPFLFGTASIICGAVGLHKKHKYSLAGLLLGIFGWSFVLYDIMKMILGY